MSHLIEQICIDSHFFFEYADSTLKFFNFLLEPGSEDIDLFGCKLFELYIWTEEDSWLPASHIPSYRNSTHKASASKRIAWLNREVDYLYCIYFR